MSKRRLSAVSYSDLVRGMRKHGFSGPYHRKRHPYMERDGLTVTIPNPHKHKDISVGLLKRILDQAGISRDEWLEG